MCMCACCSMCTCARGGMKRPWDSLELELLVVASCPMRMLEPSSGPLESSKLSLTTEPCLQPHLFLNLTYVYVCVCAHTCVRVCVYEFAHICLYSFVGQRSMANVFLRYSSPCSFETGRFTKPGSPGWLIRSPGICLPLPLQHLGLR